MFQLSDPTTELFLWSVLIVWFLISEVSSEIKQTIRALFSSVFLLGGQFHCPVMKLSVVGTVDAELCVVG